MSEPRNYEGPFDPPSADLLEDAIGWRFTSRQIPSESRWEPTGWEIVYSNSILTVDLDGYGVRDSILYAP